MQNENHPAKNFMWSAALAGFFWCWLVHRKELKKSDCNFFLPMLGMTVLMSLPNILLAAFDAPVVTEFGYVWLLVNMYVMGRFGAFRMKRCLPNYEAADYKRREKIGIIIGVVLCVLQVLEIVLVIVGTSMMDAGMNELEVF